MDFMKKIVGLICLVFVLVSCGEGKVVENDNLVDSNVDVKVDKENKEPNIEIIEEKEKTQEIIEDNKKIEIEEQEKVIEIDKIVEELKKRY
jgi:hypothetical protein